MLMINEIQYFDPILQLDQISFNNWGKENQLICTSVVETI